MQPGMILYTHLPRVNNLFSYLLRMISSTPPLCPRGGGVVFPLDQRSSGHITQDGFVAEDGFGNTPGEQDVLAR